MKRSEDDEDVALADALAPLDAIATRWGLSAAVDRRDSGDVLKLADPEGKLLLEVRQGPSGVVFAVSEGDLVLRSDHGRVRIEAKEGVEIDSKVVTITAKRLRQAISVWETKANRIVEKSKDTYRHATGLSQLRAEDVRIVAKGTLRALAERLRLKAKKDAKLDGDKILLG